MPQLFVRVHDDVSGIKQPRLGQMGTLARNLHDAKAPCLECTEVSFLVLDALLEDRNGRSVVLGDLNAVGQISQIEAGGVGAPEKGHEIAGRQE